MAETGRLSRALGFVGEPGVGKTAVAALVAGRLDERADVTVHGEAAGLLGDTPGSGAENALGVDWTVYDFDAGVEAIATHADALDAVYVVATPETLETAATYARAADSHGLACSLVVNRFREDARERVRECDGPDLVEYFYEDETIREALGADSAPVLEEWTVEAVLIDALGPETLDPVRAQTALEADETLVDVEVPTRDAGDALVDDYRDAGYRAAYFECNCRCHAGHVLARSP